MSIPLIGVTSSRNPKLYGYPNFTLAEAYTDSLVKAGAAPVLIPLGLPEQPLVRLLSQLNGILFSGGGDIHPARYGSGMHPQVNTVDEDRDRMEVFLVHQALQRGLPVMGICRGLQVINVALGGTLYEDLGEQLSGAIQHDYFKGWPRDHLAHKVEVEPGSALHAILGSTSEKVNSLHHQGVRQLAASLRPSAWAPDGVIEAAELPGYPFCLAVQWHPEWLGAYPQMRALFKAFIDSASHDV